ncbi:non-specific lipid-transfer protein C6-like [Panicum virgatum]|uniref:Bifunctional inhibitor/plant lipid transfer protein/seed storage helical domain-containing protein n=1 Tax=Panicum virgatum TaxID=38727 RepID=A0A8T0VUG7_PANVG|nr:non-specific lipid-transfer protein C6-like [Panicum virgatum]KAG2638830.1 hypothetical protein PVAP13_2NG639501 [Panicum virgatum]
MAPSKMNLLVATLLVAFAAVATPPAAAFSFPAILPCLDPFLPRIPLFPCVEPKPLDLGPKECRTPLLKMMPCAVFLTNSSVTAPSRACCDGFSAIGMDGEAICYCRLVNGDIQQLLPVPMNFTRMFSLTDACGINYFGLDALPEHCARDGSPPMTASPPAP